MLNKAIFSGVLYASSPWSLDGFGAFVVTSPQQFTNPPTSTVANIFPGGADLTESLPISVNRGAKAVRLDEDGAWIVETEGRLKSRGR